LKQGEEARIAHADHGALVATSSVNEAVPSIPTNFGSLSVPLMHPVWFVTVPFLQKELTAECMLSSTLHTTEFVSGNRDAVNCIAVIDVKGEITRNTDSFSYAASGVANSVAIVKLIQAAAKNDCVKAIIIDLDTPGGEVTASDEIYHELKLCKKPVVASHNRGHDELVQEGETGFLLPPGDAAGLAERVEALAKDRPARERLGEAGAASARAYTVAAVRRELLELLTAQEAEKKETP
jgi:hypothetical protein